jgi:hypothetical protein
MSLIVIGGHTRSVGKTSVVAGLISALHEYHWTAMKITQHGHGICSANGEHCHCATDDHSFAISEEKDRSNKSDTSRFLVGGAEQVWWARTQQGRLAEAMPLIRKKLEGAQNVILESNSIMKFLRPDLYIPVLDPATEDFKSSAQQFLDLADAIILHESAVPQPLWESVSLKAVAGRPIFRIHPPPYVTPQIVDYVRAKLSALKSPSTSQ